MFNDESTFRLIWDASVTVRHPCGCDMFEEKYTVKTVKIRQAVVREF